MELNNFLNVDLFLIIFMLCIVFVYFITNSPKLVKKI